MSEEPLKALFDAARQFPSPRPPADFPERMLRAVQREAPPRSLFDQLDALFPRFVLMAATVCLLAFGADRWLAGPDFTGIIAESTLLDVN